MPKTETTKPVFTSFSEKTGITRDNQVAFGIDRIRASPPSGWSFFFAGYFCATIIHIVTCVSPQQAIDNLNKWFSQ